MRVFVAGVTGAAARRVVPQSVAAGRGVTGFRTGWLT